MVFSEYVVLFVDALMNYEIKEHMTMTETLCFRFFYSKLWYHQLAILDECMQIYDIISRF